jgi:hypothetical protein
MITGPTLAMAASRTYLTGRAVSDDSDPTFPACDPLPLCFCIRLFLLAVFRFRVLPARVAGSARKLRCQGPMLLMARQC